MKKLIATIALLISSIAAFSTQATSLNVDFSLPKIDDKNYRKPYVAIWAEPKGDSENLLLWHFTKHKGKKDKWLPDMRRWWRKEGRYSEGKFDGITGATKGAGQYNVDLDIAHLPKKFTLFIEVVREKGGRSIVRQKIDLNSDKKQFKLTASEELGEVTINVK
ncbi:MAG: DUF2271 domain-containing protein [Psychrobium sp.]